MKLRDYEKRAVRDVPGLLKKHRRVVLVGPTGSGKTVAAAHIVRKLKRAPRVLWIAHRQELLVQAERQLLAAGIDPTDIRVLSGAMKRGDPGARITIANVQMFVGREVPDFDVLVVDEAHRTLASSYMWVLAKKPDALVLGLTATPWRLDGRGLKDAFHHMYVMAIVSEMIADGHVAKPVTYGVPYAKARALVLGVRTRKGDFEERELSRIMRKRRLMGDTVKEHARLARGRATIAYAVDKVHGKALTKRFKAAGRRTAYLDGATSKDERARILSGLATGKIEVVVSINVITEGLDVPRVKCIVMCRPTKSLTVFLQQAGRASRPWRGQRPVILDHAGNWIRLELPETERDWSLEPRANGHMSGSVKGSAERYCAHCTAINAPDAGRCIVCGVELGPSERDRGMVEERRAKLEQIRATAEANARRRAVIAELAKERGGAVRCRKSFYDQACWRSIRIMDSPRACARV